MTTNQHPRGNRAMLLRGYASAADVARALDKTLSTIHRMVDDGRIEGARDGRLLYIKLDALHAFYMNSEQPNPTMAALVMQLKKDIAKSLA